MMRWVTGLVLGGLGLAGVVVLGWWAAIRSVETPPHTVEIVDGMFELRRYARWVVAEVEREGARRDALRAGFRPLAGYIFAKHRAGDKVAMTAPVLQEPAAEVSGRWRVRFVMPANREVGDLPAPGQPDVRLAVVPARRVAAVRFAGRATDADFARRETQLRAWVEAEGLEASGPAQYAYYDDPMVPGPLRRNEVLLPVETSTRTDR